jgi:hypothetical protein
MAFGNSAKKASQNTAQDSNSQNVFLPLTAGTRVIRVQPGAEEIRFKRHWVAQEQDGTWIPAPGYNPKDTRPKKPVTVAVFDPNRGSFIGESLKWRDNPIDRWITANNIDSYAQEQFVLSVLDRTMVRKDAEGKAHWPNINNEYPEIEGLAAKAQHNTPMILGGSSGDPDGKSLYAGLIRLLKTTIGADGEILSIYDFDIKIVTSGTGKNTQRDVRDDARSVGTLPEHLATMPQYDIAAWLKPWPNDAISALFAGKEYNEVIAEYNIVQFPKLVPVFDVE